MPRHDEPISEAEASLLFEPLAESSALVLAVSGGPDSTALLWLAARWRNALRRPPRLIALTVDHGLRTESAREALAVKRLASKLKVEHRTLRWTGRKPKTGIQEAARNARYRLLAAAAKKAGAFKILTAHTLDDQAETVLFRMARGSGVAGLAGMRQSGSVPVPCLGGTVVARPLLDIPKARLIATLQTAKVPYVRDPSNLDPRFARPRLRALMPALAREGLTAERLGRLARRVERVEDLVWHVLNEAQRALCPEWRPGGGPASMDSRAFLDLPPEIRLRLLRRLITAIGTEGEPELGKLEALEAAFPRKIAVLNLPHRVRRTLAGALVTLTADKLTVERAPARRTGSKTRRSGPKTPFTKPR
jgi:tRNA(Ile)-lysidine synthase